VRAHYFAGDNWIGLLGEVARGPTKRPSELGCGRGRAFDAWFAARAPSIRARASRAAPSRRSRSPRPSTAWPPAGRRRLARVLAPLALAALGALALAGWERGRAATAPRASRRRRRLRPPPSGRLPARARRRTDGGASRKHRVARPSEIGSGMNRDLLRRALLAALLATLVFPVGAARAQEACFKRLDTGLDMTGWHRSTTNHHGAGLGWTVENGALVGRQTPVNQAASS